MSQDLPNYQVGYGKPPRHTRFRKGRSGNPRGRPKGVQNFARLANQVFNEKVAIKENGERRVITKLQAMLKQLVNKAASGDPRAVREALRLLAALAETERAEVRVGRTEKPEPPIPEEPDTAKLALALLSVLDAPEHRELGMAAAACGPNPELAAAEPSHAGPIQIE